MTWLRPYHKYLLFLILINILIAAVCLVLPVRWTDLLPFEIMLLTIAFSFISAIVIVIFLRGQSKDPHSQTLHTLVAVVMKLLLELLLSVIWFLVAKKTSLQSVLIFFVLYLALTLFLVINIIKTLKSKLL